MWHEARRQEKKIRGMMVDYRKRAERRRNFYEKFKADPTQFIQLHGRPCKIHIDASIAAAGDASSVMMPWQGHHDLLIDRFDVRAHLDYIQDYPSQPSAPDEELSTEDRHTNYERYRILVQNDYLGVAEEKFLHQIYLEEQFGPIALKQNSDGVIEKEKDKEKEKRKKGVAIGFTYEEASSSVETPLPLPIVEPETSDSDTEDDSEFDFDLCLDLSEVDTSSAHELNRIGQRFGLVSNDFYSYLINDVEEQEALRLAREQEEEKAMYSGRRARRERQAYREKRLVGRVVSPPSYAARQSPVYDKFKSCSKSRSRSPSPDNGGEITYITSFSGEEPSVVEVGKPIPTIGQLQKPPPAKTLRSHTPPVSPSRAPRKRLASKSPPRRTRSRSSDSVLRHPRKRFSPHRSRGSPIRGRYRRSRSRSRSRSRGRHDRRSRSRSVHKYRRSRSRSRSRSRRRSSSRSYTRWRRSKSRSRTKSKSRSRSLSRSRSSIRPTSPRRNPPAPTNEKTEAQPTVPRYYGRNRKDSSSSIDVSSEEDAQESANSSGAMKNESGRGCGVVSGRSDVKSAAKRLPRETPQEKLKRRMQVLLSRQFKQDKRLEREKAEKAEQERLDRAAELRDISIRIRRRERYLRHLSGEEGERERERDRGRDRSYDRSRGHSREGDRSRGHSREGDRSRDHSREGDRSRDHSQDRSRDRSRERRRSNERDRGRERKYGSGRRSRSPRSSEDGDPRSFGTPPRRTLVDY